jgi:hypothetical protein
VGCDLLREHRAKRQKLKVYAGKGSAEPSAALEASAALVIADPQNMEMATGTLAAMLYWTSCPGRRVTL